MPKEPATTMKKFSCLFLALSLSGIGLLMPARVVAQGTAFTYQGRLLDAGSPANGAYDLTFSVWDAASGGNRQGVLLTNSAVALSNGLFTVLLDFGATPFNGQARWLELGVRHAGVNGFSLLSPRQACTPTPYAMVAASAGAVTGPVAAGQIQGTLSAGNIGAGTVTAADLAPNAAAVNLSAAGQSGVASSGLILSATENNTNLVNAGYVKIYGSFGTPEAWRQFIPNTGVPPPLARNSHSAVWTGTEMIIWGGYGGSYLNDGGRYNPAVDAWTALPVTAGKTPQARLNHSAVWSGSTMIVWGGVGGTNYFNDGGLYDPVLNNWTYLSGTGAGTPVARLNHTAVWTGNAMLVWGGTSGSQLLNDGGSYNPGLNAWSYLPATLPNTPGAREFHTTVWTGTEMIVWGGDSTGGGSLLNDGGRYSPAANAWVYLPGSLAATPVARRDHTAVWTGSRMLIWGGSGASGDLQTGSSYDPAGNAWTAINSAAGATPSARESHTAVWSGTEMIVWGGYSDTSAGLLNDGARYNPTGNTWVAIPNSLAASPVTRFQHTAVWTGSEMIIWGGLGAGANPLNDGGRYNPAANAWVYLSGTAVNSPPSARSGQAGIWTGSEMIVWGGTDGTSYFNDGGRFNPALNSWAYLPGSLPNIPTPRTTPGVLWTGGEMMVWGGQNATGPLGDGGRYNPGLNSWIAVPSGLASSPGPRVNHSLLWSGAKVIVWGGSGVAGPLGDGGLYNPTSGTWAALPGSLPNTPAPRADHMAVWTGTEMVVWGGTSNATIYADGGRYNAAGNSWSYLPNSLANTPAGRSGVTAAWTGTEMIVWGGTGAVGNLADGGRFNPALNGWTAISGSLANSPSARAQNATVWTGTEMVVWGGSNNGTYYADGGRYDPAANSWSLMAGDLPNAPAARSRPTAVWAGSQMLVWGGRTGVGNFNDTFGYLPGRVLYLYQRP